MLLGASNIAWAAQDDGAMLAHLQKSGFTGLEIAPTRILPQAPYDQPARAAEFARGLQEKYGLCVCSMQSIWFGCQQKMFPQEGPRRELLEYTKKAIRFAAAVGCRSLVFGCPKNRSLSREEDAPLAEQFLRELGDYAAANGTVLAIEANPVIYGTNYLNRTAEALALVRRLGCPGLGVNLDVGTMIYNEEGLQDVASNLDLISHVHISEPNLAEIARGRPLHRALAQLLRQGGYGHYVSLEMKNLGLPQAMRAAGYVREVFG